MSVQPARRVAYEVIRAVSESDAYANLLLPVKLDRARLRGADAALATELTYGTLRRRGYYDSVIEAGAGRPHRQRGEPRRALGRRGGHPLRSMRGGPPAAVDEAVSLAREVGSRSATGFVNAVLRTVTRTRPEEWRARVVGSATTQDDRLAAEHAHPAWIVRAFRRALEADGRDGELEELLAADNLAPRVSLTALPGLARPEELAGAAPGRFSPFAQASDGGDPARWPAVREGRARVQDEGSQLAALALSRARPVVEGERWLDLCAGPGGKAALLAAEAFAGGATLVANEIIPARATLVRRALSAFPDPPQVLNQDGREIGDRFAGQFDRILLDAPCTGLGALRRRPEARWRKQPKDVPGLTRLQTELVDSAARALRPGGILAYVTCSPHLAETRTIVGQALEHGGLTALDTGGVLDSFTLERLELGTSLQVQLWPHRHGTDAMFIALLEKQRQ